jgi:hypothetical protein
MRGWPLTTALKRLRVEIATSIDATCPVLAIGSGGPRGAARVTWDGWTAAVLTHDDRRLPEDDDMPLAPIAAAGLGVSEAFQRLRGHPEAGHRDVALSLWDPTATDPFNARGNRVVWLPSEWALLGLGHLGQAYAMCISFLPYHEPARTLVRLQDKDRVTGATMSTGLLTFDGAVDEMKTRIVSAELERAGFTTAIIEERLVAGDVVHDDAPQLALIGVDNVPTRRLLSAAGWRLCIDAGLGRGVSNYTSIRLQAFPGPQRSDEVAAWRQDAPAIDVPQARSYDALRAAGADECGLVTIADKAIAVTFVGTIAACLAISEPLRALHHGPTLGVQTINLSHPARVRGDTPAPRPWLPPALRRSPRL